MTETIDEYTQLDADTQKVITRAVDLTKMTFRFTSLKSPAGEVYAYPGAGGKIAWGVNSAWDGENIARGLMDR